MSQLVNQFSGIKAKYLKRLKELDCEIRASIRPKDSFSITSFSRR
jgi:hypothetical protein